MVVVGGGGENWGGDLERWSRPEAFLYGSYMRTGSCEDEPSGLLGYWTGYEGNGAYVRVTVAVDLDGSARPWSSSFPRFLATRVLLKRASGTTRSRTSRMSSIVPSWSIVAWVKYAALKQISLVTGSEIADKPHSNAIFYVLSLYRPRRSTSV